MKKKIAILGASYLQLPLYLKAKEMGVETIGFAWAEGAIARDQCDRFYPISTLEKDKIFKVCKQEKIDGIVTIASDISVPTVSYVARNMGLIGNSINSAILCTNKFKMRQAFEKNGLKCPHFFKVVKNDDPKIKRQTLSFPLIVKPVDRSGSKGVNKVFNFEKLISAIGTSLSESICKQAIIEEFIEGIEVSVEVISFKGKHYILTITDKITSGNPHYVELEHHQPSLLSNEIQNDIANETIKSLDALSIKYGASHAEFIISKKGIYITEVGARMGGDFIGSDLVYLSTGYDFLKGVIEVALNRFEYPVKQWVKHSGVFFYSIESPEIGEIIKKNKFENVKIKSEITREYLQPLLQSADRAGYFLYQSDSKLILK